MVMHTLALNFQPLSLAHAAMFSSALLHSASAVTVRRSRVKMKSALGLAITSMTSRSSVGASARAVTQNYRQFHVSCSHAGPLAHSSPHPHPQHQHQNIGGGDDICGELARHVTPTHWKHLQQHGFCMIDGALQASDTKHQSSPTDSSISRTTLASRLLSEIHSLYTNGHMTLNHTHLVSGVGSAERLFVPKRSIFEADFTTQPQLADREVTPLCHTMVHGRQLIQAINHICKHVQDESANGSDAELNAMEIESQTVKAQVNLGDEGCFPLHFDTSSRVDGRRLTAILYLNPSWSDCDGGFLRLYPFPHSPIDIAPIHQRMVIFDSVRMLHRVMPSKKERVCVSIWMWQKKKQWEEQQMRARMQQQTGSIESSNSPFMQQQSAALKRLLPSSPPSTLSALSLLLSPPYFTHFLKLYYQHEWFESLEQSHPTDSAHLQHLLIQHLDDCERIQMVLHPLLAKLSETGKEWRGLFPLPTLQQPSLPAHCYWVHASGPNTSIAPNNADSPPSDSDDTDDAASLRLVQWLE